MELTQLKSLVKSEVESQLATTFINKIDAISLEPDEILILSLKGPFTQEHYVHINQVLKDRFGKRAIAIGSDKDYNIEIFKGKWKNDENS